MSILVFNNCFINPEDIQSCIMKPVDKEEDKDEKMWVLQFTFTNGHGIRIYRDSEEECRGEFERVIKELE